MSTLGVFGVTENLGAVGTQRRETDNSGRVSPSAIGRKPRRRVLEKAPSPTDPSSINLVHSPLFSGSSQRGCPQKPHRRTPDASDCITEPVLSSSRSAALTSAANIGFGKRTTVKRKLQHEVPTQEMLAELENAYHRSVNKVSPKSALHVPTSNAVAEFTTERVSESSLPDLHSWLAPKLVPAPPGNPKQLLLNGPKMKFGSSNEHFKITDWSFDSDDLLCLQK
jgi:hypothetical protein